MHQAPISNPNNLYSVERIHDDNVNANNFSITPSGLKYYTILITPKLSQESEDVSNKKKILFKSDKKNPDLLILNENLNTAYKLNIKNNVNFSKYKRTIINNFVSSDNFNLSNESKTDQIKKTIIEMARELSSKVNL